MAQDLPGKVAIQGHGSEKLGVGTMKSSLGCVGALDSNVGIWLIVALLSGWPFIACGSDITHRVYTPQSIQPDQARLHVQALGTCTVTRLPNSNGLLITGPTDAVNKAINLLGLVDTDRPYEVRLIGPQWMIKDANATKRIAAAFGDLAIGTLDCPPGDRSKKGVIIDRCAGNVLLAAPKDRFRLLADLIEGKGILGLQQEKPIIPSEEGIIKPIPFTGLGLQDQMDGSADALRISSSQGQGFGPSVSPDANHQFPQVPNAEATLNLDLPEKLSIDTLLSFVGEYLRLDFMYDPAKVQGEVTLRLQGDLRGPIRVRDLYPLLESVLKFKGFAMVRRGNIVTVVPATEVMDADPKLRVGPGPVELGDATITRVFRLKYVDPASAEALLTQMKLGVAFSSVAETKTLMVTGYTYSMPKIEALLDLIDQPGEQKIFRYRQLQYTIASVLVEKIKALAEQMDTVQVSVSITQAQPQIQRLPGETDAAYRARVAREQAVRQAQQAAARATAPTPTPEMVYLDADERTNRILMIGKQAQLANIEKLMDCLDVEQRDPRMLKLYRIQHVDAEDARRKLEALNIIPPQPTTTPTRLTAAAPTAAATGATARPSPQPMVAPETTRAVASPEVPQVVVIEATNSLLVNATFEQLEKIEEILRHIDVETLESAMPFEIYPLENQSPERMAEILNKIIEERVQDKEGKIEQVVKKIEDIITVVPDPNTYSLIVHASPKNQQWIGRLIKTLDKRRPQVLIDVTLVEVSKTEDFNYDLSLISSFPNFDKATDLVGQNGLVPGRLRTGNIVQAASGALTGFYGDAHINALLTAMQNKKYGRVLAKPKVLVNDHQTGTIKTTDTTYVLTKQSTLPTQGLQLVQTAEQYQPYEAGITLEITPHISEGDLLQLDIKLTRSDFTTQPAGTQPPDKSQSDITTVVTVPNGSTIILGGMLKLNQIKGGAKVPIIGDLPLLGAAFRKVGNSDVEKKLYVFVKAEIIRPADILAGEDSLRRLSERYRSAFEQHERAFQEYQTVPGVKSVPMNPERVLDAQ